MTEETFVRELERRAGHVHGAPLSFADVRGRARSIQRRRRSTAAAAAAALVAAVLVAPSLLADGPERPEPAPAPVRPPGASVLYDGVLTRPDGSTVPLDVDNATLLALGVLTDGRIVTASFDPDAVRVFTPDGALQSTHDVGLHIITMGANDTLAAWVDDEQQATVLESGVTEPTVLGKVPKVSGDSGTIGAVYGEDCAGGGCTVLAGDSVTTTTEITAAGTTDLPTSEPLAVQDVSPDASLWAVSFPPGRDEQFGCSGLYDPVAEAVVARSCDATVDSFSPDGTLLTSARGDNQMFGSVDVLDERLDVVLRYKPSTGEFIKGFGWEDAEHLLVTVGGFEPQPSASLVRVPVDGGPAEVVQGPVENPNVEFEPTYVVSD